MVRPDYYDKFQCIADRCKHTCCAGWEIDIDGEALSRYQKMEGPLGKKLRDQIVLDEEPHFKLGEGERCPFLDERNLCQIILACGEEQLCQICRDHPRFRNERNGGEEIGVGLCCEAAAELILGKKEKTTLLGEDPREDFQDPLEQQVFQIRKEAIRIIQDRDLLMEERAERLLETFSVRIPEFSLKQWTAFYLSLERMDEAWTEELEKLGKEEEREVSHRQELSNLEVPLEQFFVYLLYRHLPQTQDWTDWKAQLGYAYVNYKLLRWLCLGRKKKEGCSLEDCMELARLLSSEIEYSQENTDEILDLIWNANWEEEV